MAVRIFGWRRGYVGFATAVDQVGTTSQTMTVVATSSADGLHWMPARSMNIAGLRYEVEISEVAQGPAGLLAVGHYGRGACGGPATADALWTSTDGLAWHRVKPPPDFASARVYTVDGGSSGFIASGTLKDGVSQAVWLSQDGRSWHRAPLPKSTFGKTVVDGATSFSAGYVVSGAVFGNEGCGGPALLTPSLWWSANGTSWSRSKLRGATPAPDAWMTVSRIDDHALIAIATGWNAATQRSTQRVWVTADGRTWTLVRSPSKLLGAGILTTGQRGVVVATPADYSGPPTIATVGDDLTVTALQQTGDGPVLSATSPGWVSAFGPTGVVILSSDASNLWLGVPTAR